MSTPDTVVAFPSNGGLNRFVCSGRLAVQVARAKIYLKQRDGTVADAGRSLLIGRCRLCLTSGVLAAKAPRFVAGEPLLVPGKCAVAQ